jgi:hypothetical protein
MDICSENREPKNKTWRWHWQATSLQFEGFDVDPNRALTFELLQAGLQSQAMERRQQALQIEMGLLSQSRGINGVAGNCGDTGMEQKLLAGI